MNHLYVVFDQTTGAVKRSGSCQLDTLANQVIEANEAVVETETLLDPNLYRVDLETLEILPK